MIKFKDDIGIKISVALNQAKAKKYFDKADR